MIASEGVRMRKEVRGWSVSQGRLMASERTSVSGWFVK